jgi:hypothetical protein
MATLINLTPHSITTIHGGIETTLPSQGVARVATKPGQPLGGLFYSSTSFGEVEGLPAPEEGKVFIVSALVAGRCIGRADVFSPGTGPNDGAVRDDKGQIKAVTRLIQAPQA